MIYQGNINEKINYIGVALMYCCVWYIINYNKFVTKVMQYLLGHTDIRTTMRVYNHVDKGRVNCELQKSQKMQTIIG